MAILLDQAGQSLLDESGATLFDELGSGSGPPVVTYGKASVTGVFTTNITITGS